MRRGDRLSNGSPARKATLALALGLALATPALSQDGPLSEYSSGGVRSPPRSVRDGATTIREGSSGSMRSGSVRPGSRGMLSGPLSEMSAGSVRGSAGVRDDTSIGESSAGAVKHRLDAPLGSRISQSLTDLEELQDELRQIQPAGGGVPAETEPTDAYGDYTEEEVWIEAEEGDSFPLEPDEANLNAPESDDLEEDALPEPAQAPEGEAPRLAEPVGSPGRLDPGESP